MGIYDNGKMILIIMLIVALIGKIIINVAKTRFIKENFNNLNSRLNTWFIIIFLFLISTFGKFNILFLFFMISYLGFKEFIKIFGLKLTKKEAYFYPMVISIHYFFVYQEKINLFYFFIPILILLLNLKKGNKGQSLALFISTYLIGFITYLINFKIGIEGLILYIVAIQLNDVYQYITGNMFGKIKIAPKISPKKTLGGALGGIILSILTIHIYNVIFDFGVPAYLGALISILGLLGDIFISYFKRRYQVKDSGKILPGHGGILDRIDSLVFVSSFIYFQNLLSLGSNI